VRLEKERPGKTHNWVLTNRRGCDNITFCADSTLTTEE
jgi:hypothetical protein